LSGVISGFDQLTLGYRWENPDPQVDVLQQAIQSWVMTAEEKGMSRQDIFAGVWKLAHRHAGEQLPDLPMIKQRTPIPRLSENWYCCAEPTSQQLSSF